VKPDGRTPQLLSVFFPSLSRDILWKLGAVSRVRSAAQKTRALDTAPSFQQNPADKKAKGRSSEPKPRVGCSTAAQTQTHDPVGISLLRAKNGLDNGVHFRKRHTAYVNRGAKKSSTVPRHREINDFLARKICDDLQVPQPG
jgi:hypothetical protein